MNLKQYQVVYTMHSGDRVVSVEEATNLHAAVAIVAKHLEQDKFVLAVNMKDRVLKFDPRRVESYGIRLIDPKAVAQKLAVAQAAGDNQPKPETAAKE